VRVSTERIDKKVASFSDQRPMEVGVEEIKDLISLTMPDQSQSERVWDATAVAESVMEFAKLFHQNTGYLYVDRERGLKENRRETQGILDGGEAGRVPADKITLFLLRTKAERGKNAAWWPQIRFPDGRYAFAFAV
jgi:hypothetical protein